MKHYYTRDGLRASSSKNLSQITTSDNYEQDLLILGWLLFNAPITTPYICAASKKLLGQASDPSGQVMVIVKSLHSNSDMTKFS